MSILAPLCRAAFFAIAVTGSYGCFCDSIQPWLQADSILQVDVDLEGEWEIVNEEFRKRYSVTLDKDKDPRRIERQNYYIRVVPSEGTSSFNFVGAVHQVNGIKFAQIENFNHSHDEVFRLANHPVVSLWQICYDDDNIILWPPSFLREDASALRTMQDSDDKTLVIDTTDNLRAYVEAWTRDYPQKKNDVRMILPLALTRAGTEFEMPRGMQALVPRVYEQYMKDQGE